MQLLTYLGLLATLLAAPSLAAKFLVNSSCNVDIRRLPPHVVPKNYELQLMPDLESFTFWGRVSIDVAINHERQRYDENVIVLHAHKSLELLDAYYESSGKLSLLKNRVKSICREDKTDALVLTLDRALKPDTDGKLTLEFKGVIGDQPYGFYKSPYKRFEEMTAEERAANRKFMVATFFEPTYARRAFPCFDEPQYKATFDVSIAKQSDELTVLANTDVVREELVKVPSASGWRRDKVKFVRFAKTPLMSTYLLSFAIGKLDFVECKSSRDIRVRMYTAPGKKDLAQYGLVTACKSLSLLEKYFGIPFPLAKIDMLAIPEFAMGAMENWGLVTYREDQILVMGDQTATHESRATAARMVMHEFSHQWFGNLVTMKWWNDLWLNEGFASWLASSKLQELYPDLDEHMDNLKRRQAVALRHDGVSYTHQVSMVASDVHGDIMKLFDQISYSKSAAIIRWLRESIVGPAGFEAAITSYLKEHQWGNAEKSDLVASIERVSRTPVAHFLHSWLDQPGYPMVTVSSIPEKNTITLVQRRFMEDSTGDSGALWDLRLVLLLGDDNTGRLHHERITMGAIKTGAAKLPDWFKLGQPGFWFKLNPGMVGFYRTRYSSPGDVQALTSPLAKRLLPAADRFHLLEDQTALCVANKAPWTELVDMLGVFASSGAAELDGTVLERMSDSLSLLRRMFGAKVPVEFGASLFEGAFEKLGARPAANEGRSSSLARQVALSNLIAAGHQGAVAAALELFDGGLDSVGASVHEAVYMAVARHGDERQYGQLKRQASSKVRNFEQRNRLATGWAQATKQERLADFWDWARQPEVALSNRVGLLKETVLSAEGLQFVLKLVRERFGQVAKLTDLKTLYSLIETSRSSRLLEAAKSSRDTPALGDTWRQYLAALEKVLKLSGGTAARDEKDVGKLVAEWSAKLAKK